MQCNSPLCMCITSITKPTWSSCVSLPSSYNFKHQSIRLLHTNNANDCPKLCSLYHIKFFNALGKLMQFIEIHTMEFHKICKSFKHKHNTTIESIFTIKVPLFWHMTQRLGFCYFPNIKSLWNKFKWKYWIIQIMIICMVVVIFHVHIIMYKYFCKKL
jgi:hypothetical protein